MATYQEITFNREIFHSIILEELDKAMSEAIEEVWSSDDYYGQIIKNKETNGYEYEIVFKDIRAWVVYFGQGRDLDTSNPFLGEYMSSEFWADGRPTNGTVVKRGASPYDQYDYRSGTLRHYAKGAEPAGQPLIDPLQRGMAREPKVNFWNRIEETFEYFSFKIDVYTERIEQRLISEALIVSGNKTV